MQKIASSNQALAALRTGAGGATIGASDKPQGSPVPSKPDQSVKKQNGSNLLAKGPGRPKGVPNRATTEFRDTVRALLEDNSANVGKWLAEVAQGKPAQLDEHGQILRKEVPAAPEKALDLLAKLAEYAAPKLNRTEHVGADGGAIQTVSRIELVPLAPGDKT